MRSAAVDGFEDVDQEPAQEVAEPVAEAATRGAQDDFAEFYRAELPGLVALARGLCGTAIADDIAQEAMLATYRRWSEVARFDQPQVWVRRTCANMAISTFRRRIVELRGLTRLAARPEVQRVDAPSEEFWEAVRTLSRRQAQCTALRYLYEMSGQEIAVTLDISEGAVKVHLARARERLARILGSDGEGRS